MMHKRVQNILDLFAFSRLCRGFLAPFVISVFRAFWSPYLKGADVIFGHF